MSDETLKSILKLSRNAGFHSAIDDQMVESAKYTVVQWVGETYGDDDIFRILLSLNLLNAAVKRKKYKKMISYGLIKSRVAQLFFKLINKDKANGNIQFYINREENCAYVEMKELQFSFHQISLIGDLKEFALSEENIVSPWRGIRLQRIAAELYKFFLLSTENKS